jgi:anaerobic dimethyl sulfoxide reductase subunit A
MAFGHEWIPIIPGTDTAMLVAMANVIITNNLQDQQFLDRYTIGFDKYKDYVMGVEDGIVKTPAWAEPITDVPASTIEALAREYASSKPAALFAPWGPGRTAFGEQFHRAAIVLAAMTGNVGIHGGNAAGWERGYPSMLHEQGMPVTQNQVQIGAPPRKNALLGLTGGTNPTSARFHACKLWDAILEGKSGGYPADIKMLYNMGGDPLNRLPDINRGTKALKTLDFIVVHSQFMYGIAKYADIVFPVSTFYEREDMSSPFTGAPYYVYCNKVIDPLYESKSDVQICTDLAERLGIEGYNDKTEEEWMKEFLEAMPEDIEFDEFKKRGIWEVPLDEPWISFKEQIEDPENNPFPTPSGKIEIFSQLLADMDNPLIPPIPKYIEHWEGRNDPLVAKYPLQMINSHMGRRANTVLENVSLLRSMTPHVVWINPLDAQPRGINNGEKVRVFNGRGEMVVTAKVTERIMPDVTHLTFGAHYKPDENSVDRGGAANILTKTEHSPGGALCTNTCLVEVKKA